METTLSIVHDTHLPSDNARRCFVLMSSISSRAMPTLWPGGSRTTQSYLDFACHEYMENHTHTQEIYWSSISTLNLTFCSNRSFGSSPSSRRSTQLAQPAKQHTDIRADLDELTAIPSLQEKLPWLHIKSYAH